MDYLSYFQDANIGTNADDYTVYQAVDALNSINNTNFDVLTQNIVGNQLTKESAEQVAQAKELSQNMKDTDIGASMTSAGGLILGRAKAIEIATKAKEAVFGKAEAAPEEGTVTETT